MRFWLMRLLPWPQKTHQARTWCIVGYYIGTSKNCVCAKFLHTLYAIKSVYIKFLELIKNRVSTKSVLKEAVYNEALLYIIKRSFVGYIENHFVLGFSEPLEGMKTKFELLKSHSLSKIEIINQCSLCILITRVHNQVMKSALGQIQKSASACLLS